MSELVRHPFIMENVRLEITEKLGVRGKMVESVILGPPQLQAVVKETMRLHLSEPLLLPHKMETDVSMYGYVIPKNTQVLVNAQTIAPDAEYWKNPTCMFYAREVFGFSSGRRIRPGLPLAHRVVLSLMIASLVYHFHWNLPFHMTPEKLDMNDKFGLTLQKERHFLLSQRR